MFIQGLYSGQTSVIGQHGEGNLNCGIAVGEGAGVGAVGGHGVGAVGGHAVGAVGSHGVGAVGGQGVEGGH